MSTPNRVTSYLRKLQGAIGLNGSAGTPPHAEGQNPRNAAAQALLRHAEQLCRFDEANRRFQAAIPDVATRTRLLDAERRRNPDASGEELIDRVLGRHSAAADAA